MIPRTCLVCRTQLDYPVEYTINEDIIYDETVLEKYKVSTPTPIALIMAGMALSAKDRATQMSNKHISYFPSWPLTNPEEVKSAVCSAGLHISCGAGYSMPSMKIQTANFVSKEKLIGTDPPNGFGELKYLSAITATNRTERFKQQADFLRYLKA